MHLKTPIDDLVDSLKTMQYEHVRYQCLMARATEFQFIGPNGRYIARDTDPKSTLIKTWDVYKHDGEVSGHPQYVLVEKMLSCDNACRLAAEKAGLTEGVMSEWYHG